MSQLDDLVAKQLQGKQKAEEPKQSNCIELFKDSMVIREIGPSIRFRARTLLSSLQVSE